MVSFVALYRGATISEARMVAVTTDPYTVAEVAGRILQEPRTSEDPVVATLNEGQRRALRLIKEEADA